MKERIEREKESYERDDEDNSSESDDNDKSERDDKSRIGDGDSLRHTLTHSLTLSHFLTLNFNTIQNIIPNIKSTFIVCPNRNHVQSKSNSTNVINTIINISIFIDNIN